MGFRADQNSLQVGVAFNKSFWPKRKKSEGKKFCSSTFEIKCFDFSFSNVSFGKLAWFIDQSKRVKPPQKENKQTKRGRFFFLSQTKRLVQLKMIFWGEGVVFTRKSFKKCPFWVSLKWFFTLIFQFSGQTEASAVCSAMVSTYSSVGRIPSNSLLWGGKVRDHQCPESLIDSAEASRPLQLINGMITLIAMFLLSERQGRD